MEVKMTVLSDTNRTITYRWDEFHPLYKIITLDPLLLPHHRVSKSIKYFRALSFKSNPLAHCEN